jgi:hypothetical protein
MKALFLLLPFVAGCVPWGDASQWSGVPDLIVSWELLLDEGGIPSQPPPVDYLGLDGFGTDARYVDEALDQGTLPWCHISVGTAESWRDDYASFIAVDAAEVAAGSESILGGDFAGEPGERWLNIQRYEVFLEIMVDRFRMCSEKGFELVEFDKMDASTAATGLSITQQDVRSYTAALISEAQEEGLGVIQKNGEGLIPDLEPSMDVLLLESCVLDDFCLAGRPFLDSGKPVLNVEYSESWGDAGRNLDIDDMCAIAEAAGANAMLKTRDLDERSVVCAAR